MSQSDSTDVLLRTKPTLKPTLLLLSIVTVLGVAITSLYLTSTVVILNNEILTRVVGAAVGVISALLIIRLIIHVIVLRRTTYIIRAKSLERVTDMIVRYRSRKAPVDELRGFEYSQNPIQTVLGYGSIQLLTAGTNQSLGFLVFEDLPNASEARQHIEQLIE